MKVSQSWAQDCSLGKVLLKSPLNGVHVKQCFQLGWPLCFLNLGIFDQWFLKAVPCQTVIALSFLHPLSFQRMTTVPLKANKAQDKFGRTFQKENIPSPSEWLWIMISVAHLVQTSKPLSPTLCQSWFETQTDISERTCRKYNSCPEQIVRVPLATWVKLLFIKD